MGIFTWTDAAVKNPVSNEWGEYKKEDIVEYGEYAKLICPDDTEIETEHHDYYGMIGGYDIYDLVAEWNRFYLSADNLSKKPDDSSRYLGLWDYQKEELKEQGYSDDEIDRIDKEKRMEHFNNAVSSWERMAALIDEYKTGASETELAGKYGNEWKREIGIEISCEDDNARKLKYPIKLTKDRNAHGYNNLHISYSTQ